MKDRYGRSINYLRISVTDRCNLRCKYCVEPFSQSITHHDVLRYEEILTICRVATELGIRRFKITGGEPLVRKGLADCIGRIKGLPGAPAVTLTTNGVLLPDYAEQLKTVGIDGVNISLDVTDKARYHRLTGVDALEAVRQGILRCVALNIKTKLNCVLLEENRDQIPKLAEYARDYPVDVRFIELMPLGPGKGQRGLSRAQAGAILKEVYPDLKKTEETRGFGPAWYEASAALQGRIGWIDALSHSFCAGCNRVRLTSTGRLKPCLCYGGGAVLRALLRNGKEAELKHAMETVLFEKPAGHCFGDAEAMQGDAAVERGSMVAIGG